MEYSSYFLKIFAFVWLLQVSLVKGQQRIIGGFEAPSRFGLFHASLQNWSGDHVCGGAVISRRHVVTAAHCLYEAQPEHIKVVVGTTNLNSGGVKYNATSIIIHKAFDFKTRVNDIALLRVQQPFDSSHVQILNFYENHISEGNVVFLAGFGAQQLNGTSSTQMHVLTLPVFSQETCIYAMRYTREVVDSMFCTFTRIGQGTCSGDSGSPIIKDDKLVGLVSWGIPCAKGFPDVHTRIAPFIDWINIELGKYTCKCYNLFLSYLPRHIVTYLPVFLSKVLIKFSLFKFS